MPDEQMDVTPEDDARAQAEEAARLQKMAGEWKNRLEASEHVVDDLKKDWQKNVRAYMGKVLASLPRDHVVNVPVEYQYVELKKAQLMFQVPELHLKPKNPQSAAAVPIFQAAINHELGPENIDAPTLIEEIATDVLICGIAASKIGYTADIRTRQVPVMEMGPPDPMTGQQAQVQAQRPVQGPDGMLQFGPDGQPVTEPAFQDEEYVADESYFWERFPTEDLLLPVDFVGSNFDRAAWIGMKFTMDFAQAQKAYDLPPDFATTISAPKETLSSDERPARDGAGASLKQVEGYEIWLKAAVFEPDEDPLPRQIKHLVLIKGHDTPVVYRDSPYQWMGQDGKLKGMEGFPIHPLTLRFLPGSQYPVSDVGIARPLSEELSLGRTQVIQFRDRAMPQWWYRRDLMDPETKAKWDRGEMLSKVGLDGNGNEAIGVVAMPTMPRETGATNELVTKDLEKTYALRPPTVEAEGRTATEVNTASAVSDVRLDKERSRFLRWFTSGGGKVGSLIQQYKDEPGYVEISGPDAQGLQAWDRTMVQGEFVFTAKPDSALRLDADVERRQIRDLYNLLGRDPNVRRDELLKSLCVRHNLDPDKIVAPTPPPPEPKPEPPKFNFSFKGEDLSNPVVLGLLYSFGIEVPGVPPPQPQGQPGAPGQPPGQAPHPGATPQAEPISKHMMRGGEAPTVN
jgi:hypothetical protein